MSERGASFFRLGKGNKGGITLYVFFYDLARGPDGFDRTDKGLGSTYESEMKEMIPVFSALLG